MTQRRRKRVLCDVDGVLADFVTAAFKVVEDITGKPVPANTIDDWNLVRHYSKAEQTLFDDVIKSKGWCASLPVYPGAQDGLRRLTEVADIYFVTSPMNGPYWGFEREEWLGKHFGVHRHKIVHTNAKYICVGDVFIDDKADDVNKWEEHHPTAFAVLWDQPYNRRHTQLRRANDWNGIIELVVEREAGHR